MIRNYLRIAWRNLLKYRVISFINLFGLTVGLTCCLLITAYVINELSYDRYNRNAENTYRITRSFNNIKGVVSLRLSTISPPFGYYLPADFPEIRKMTRLLENGNLAVRTGNKLITQPDVYFADENLFDVFTIPVLKGNSRTALAAPFTTMLSEETAKKYFGDEDPIGKKIRADNQLNLTVTGVYKPWPANSHMHPEMLVSFNTLRDSAVYGEANLRTNWGNNSFFTYIVLPENYDPKRMEARFPAFVNAHMPPPKMQGNKASDFTTLALQKLTDIHLRSHTDFEAEPNGDFTRVVIFGGIALFILLIACINYMNLSTARSALRAREIGIRKTVGAGRGSLIAQFLSESVILTWVSTLFAIALLFVMLPWLNRLSGQELSVKLLLRWQVITALLAAPFLIGALSGLYPALFMSSFQPVKTLKGLFKASGNISLRKTLVVVQFSISIVLMIVTIIVFQQLGYVRNKTLGYEKEHVVVLPYSNQLSPAFEAFRNDLLRSGVIADAGRSSRVPTGRLLDNQGASTQSGDTLAPVTTDIKYVAVDYDFIPTYKIPLAAGRNFSRNYGTDTAGFIINEAAVRALDWKGAASAIGKVFKYGNVNGHIIGVVKDFNFESVHQSIAPMVLLLPPGTQSGAFNQLSVRLAGGNPSASLAALESVWRKFLPESPWQYKFLDENYSKLYESEQKQSVIFTTFSLIAILIACLGLFGLSAFTILQRVKEIGVRKVLGSSTSGIVALLSADFLKLVMISAFVAFPLAWYAMSRWLEGFAYHVSIQWWVFISAALAACFVALATIGFQAVKAALANPVRSLRSE